ncbi:radical SAM protein [Saccharopolyspora endophytica]|uniref:Radical SAM protein n=1 Tax=Saccharopolyspora endophytica TaxID=543886 RepID=A0ABS5DK92_9PSEU|nr:radical SAM protein [Saccharopolyspora endophytica]MBQ0926713.1 radical SAM protein [Saccharopolyspora endophytica]
MTTLQHTMATTHRVFATGVCGHTRYVHDPLTGLTHRTEDLITLGRARLPGSSGARWPTIHPGELDRDVPVSVCWSPLVRCNLACPHCLDDKTVRELARKDRQRIAALLGESGVLAVDLSGGEPLLLRDLGDLAATLTSAGCVVSVTTNGWHLQRRAEALAGQVDAVRVSLDGPEADSHDRWRGADSFHRAVAGIRAAVAHGIPTQLQVVLMASTRGSAQRMVDLAASLGAQGVTFLQMLPIGEGTTLAGAEQLTDEEAAATVADLDIPDAVTVRLRTRDDAGGFTVVRADGRVWRNDPTADRITTLRALTNPSDLALTGMDGSA